MTGTRKYFKKSMSLFLSGAMVFAFAPAVGPVVAQQVAPELAGEYVAWADEEITTAKALTSALSGSETTITLNADIEFDSDTTLNISSGKTVNTAGHTISVKSGTLTVTGGGTVSNSVDVTTGDAQALFEVAKGASLHLSGGKYQTVAYRIINDYGSVVIDGNAELLAVTDTSNDPKKYDGGSVIMVEGDDSAPAAIDFKNGSLKQGKYSSTSSDGIYGVFISQKAVGVFGEAGVSDSALVMETDYAPIGTNNTMMPVDITINSGTYTTKSFNNAGTDGAWERFNSALFCSAEGSYVINGGTFSGTRHAIALPYVTAKYSLEINGGTFKTSASASSSDSSIAAIYVGALTGKGSDTPDAQQDSYIISGGNFADSAKALYAETKASVTADTSKLTIIGGTFKSDDNSITSMIASGSTNSSGVVSTNGVARIGSTVYTTISNAIQAVSDNASGTIVLLKDVTEDVTVPAGRDIILNLAGHTLSSTSATSSLGGSDTATNAITNNGTLRITGGGTIKGRNGIIMPQTSSTTSKLVVDSGTITGTAAQGIWSAGNVVINGGTISSNVYNGIYNSGGTVMINGGSVSGKANGYQSTNGVLTMTGGTITGEGSGLVLLADSTDSNTKAEILGGTIIGEKSNGIEVLGNTNALGENETIDSKTSYGVNVRIGGSAEVKMGNNPSSGSAGVIVFGKGAKLTVEDNASITGKGFGVAGNGSSTSEVNYGGTDIEIKGGTIKAGTDGAALFQPQAGTLKVSGGVMEAGVALHAKSGSILITGGVFKSNATSVTAYAHSGNGNTVTGDAVIIETCDYPGGEVNVTPPDAGVTGGTFTGIPNAKGVACYAQESTGADYKPAGNFISGGTFSSDVAEYCVDSYSPVATTADGKTTYGVVKAGMTIAQVLEAAEAYQYTGESAYTYSGNIEISGSEVTYKIGSAVFSADASSVMNDLARYLGALHRCETPAAGVPYSVEQITYNGKAYTWNSEGTLLGSNWVDSSNTTLVSALVGNSSSPSELSTALAQNKTATAALKLNGVDVTLTAKVLDQYTVTYNSNYGTTPTTTIDTVYAGEKLTEPAAPTRTGYTFGGWYKEASCTNAWNFSEVLSSANTTNGALTLYAKWTATPAPPESDAAKVTNLINALPAANAVKATDETAITAARTAYNALSATEKQKVTADTLKKLTDAEDALAVVKVNAALNALPAADKVAATDESAITAARTAYDKLTTAQKQKVTAATLKKLTDAESALAVAKVNAAIAALPAADKVTAADADAIAAAQKAFEALTADQKKQVSDADQKKLADAVAAAKAIADAAADQSAADKVKQLIDALPAADKVADTDADAITTARKAYDALTDAQKKLIDAATLAKLTDAEAALAQAPIGGVKAGQTATYGSGDAKATYEVETPATAAEEGTVYYAASAAAKKAKTIKVPATVEISGGTYKVVGVKGKAFTKCTKLTKVTLGKNVKTVKAKAFFKVKKLTTVKLSAATTTIGKQAFAGSKKLKSLVITKNVKSVGAQAFKGCAKLKTITVKSKKLTTKKSVKNMLKGSKVTTVKLKGLGSKKAKVKKAIKKYAGKSGLKFK